MFKSVSRKRLYQPISDYIPYRTVPQLYLLVANIFPQEHVLCMYILSFTIISRIFSQSYCPLIIIEDDCGQYNSVCSIHSCYLSYYKYIVLAHFFGIYIESDSRIRCDLNKLFQQLFQLYSFLNNIHLPYILNFAGG